MTHRHPTDRGRLSLPSSSSSSSPPPPALPQVLKRVVFVAGTSDVLCRLVAIVQIDPWRSTMQQVLHLFNTQQPLDKLQLKTSLIPSRTLLYGRMIRNYVDEFIQWPKDHNDLVSIDPVQADMIAMEILSMALDPRFDATLAQFFDDLRVASKMAMPDLPETFGQS